MRSLSLSSLLVLLVSCGTPPEVTLSGPTSVTVFAGGEVGLPLTLQWDGEPRALTVSGTSGTGLSVASTAVSAGSTQAALTLVATAEATDGTLELSAAGEEVEAALSVPVTVAAASVVSGPGEPLLRGAQAVGVVAFTGGTPVFEGVTSAEALPDGQWRVRVPVPTSATPGEVSLSFTVRAGDATRTLQLPVTVVAGVTVTMQDDFGVGLPGHQVFLDGVGPVLTDAEGKAHFADVVAPYRLSAFRTLSNISADTYVDATLAFPVLKGQETHVPEKSALLVVSLYDANNQPLTGHTTAWVHVSMQGQPEQGGVSFAAGGNQSAATIRWRSTSDTVRARLRAVAWVGQQLSWYSDQTLTLSAGAEEITGFLMRPAPLGTIRSEVELPEEFAVEYRELRAVFAGNRFDWMSLPGDDTSNLNVDMNSALAEDAADHSLAVVAADLPGRLTRRQWAGLKAGDTAAGALRGPPELTTPVGGSISGSTEYTWGGPTWPVYLLSLSVGEGGDRRAELIYTPHLSAVRTEVVSFVSSSPATYRLCASDLVQSVDELLRGDRGFSYSLTHAYNYGCDVSLDSTYTGP